MHRRDTPPPPRRPRRRRAGATATAVLAVMATLGSWGFAQGAQAETLGGATGNALAALTGQSATGSSSTPTHPAAPSSSSTATTRTATRSAATTRTTTHVSAPSSASSIPASLYAKAAHVSPLFGCATPAHAGAVHCLGQFSTQRTADGRLLPRITGSPTSVGYTPSDIRSAYHLSGTSGAGRTVAIVDAYDDPNAEADLAKYRSAYGLSACTTANGCFKKVNQNGSTSSLPTGDYGWAEEISLDLDMVSATCPDCHIQLVEANSANTPDLMKAEDTAANTPGVVAVSNSWGGTEDSTITGDDSHFSKAGVAFTASSGDSGYGVIWPASSPKVTAVGGTSLNKASNSRGWSESAWSGAGSGCSQYEAKPSWQKDTGCGTKRTVADVSAVADPNTGVAVYDTYNSCGSTSLCDTLLGLGLGQGADGWVQVGGTSASSPIIASVYALAGNTSSVTAGSYPYSHTSALNDVTSGSNSTAGCSPSYLCKAGTGYDGPTGLGTPNGTGAF